jgi:hypothetical protein
VKARETLERATPAACATWLIVGTPLRALMPRMSSCFRPMPACDAAVIRLPSGSKARFRSGMQLLDVQPVA